MGQADIVIKAYFFEYGKQAPKYSEFRGIVTSETMFGGKSSWANYTSRKESIKDSMQTEDEEMGSFAGYTAREAATNKSAEQYFTRTDSKRLYTNEDRKEWADESKKYFSKPGNIAWTLVVSLQDTSLLQKYAIKDQKDLSDMTCVSMNKILKRMGLNPDNVLWWEDYHTNKKNPHMHITFMSQLFAEIARNARTETSQRLKYPLNIIWDEFGISPPVKNLNNALSASRSKGVRFTLVIQDFSQLSIQYNKNFSEMIKNNTMNISQTRSAH
jgi:Type IV secretory pathway, VirD4 components